MRLIKLLFSIACLAALIWWTDPAEVLARLRGTDLSWVMLALLALSVATFSMASRWQRTARAFGIEFGFAFALREYYLAQLVNTVLPGGVAGDVTRALRLKSEADLTHAAQSVMAERLIGQIYMFGLMLCGFAGAFVLPGGPNWAHLGWVMPLGLIGGVITIWGLMRRNTSTARFLQKTTALLRDPMITLQGALTTASLILGFYACARATGTALPPAAWATLIPLVLCAMLIPLSIGGWGWREGAAAGLFPIVGAPASAGIATGITYGVVLFVAVLPAAFILLYNSFSETFAPKGNLDLS